MLRVNTRLVRHPSDLDKHRAPFTVSQANLNHGETVNFCGVPFLNSVAIENGSSRANRLDPQQVVGRSLSQNCI